MVLYDALVSGEISAMARRDAVKISVGKRAGAYYVQQEGTSRLLTEHAQKGERTMRLEGGDLFVFGHGGEGVQALRQIRIVYRTAPGIAATPSATAYVGISPTHRDCAQSTLFVTDHSKHKDS